MRPRNGSLAQRRLLLALALIAVALPASAGVVFELEITNQAGFAGGRTILVSAEGGDLRLDISSVDRTEQAMTVIFLGAKPEMLLIDHRKKTYLPLDQEAIDWTLEENRKRGLVHGTQVGELPVAPTHGSSGTGAESREELLEYRASGERDTINGYPAERYDVYKGERQTRVIWLADWKHVDGSFDIIDGFQALGEFGTKLRQAMGKSAFPLGGLLQINELGGFPVVNRALDKQGGTLSLAQLVRNSHRELGAVAFEVPEGYEKLEIGTLGSQ